MVKSDTMIPYGRQEISEDDIEAVVEVLRSEWLTQGPVVPKFERAIADYVGAKHAVAVNSATSALHLACLALNAGPGDWVWTTPNTFVASANCAEYCGAQVDFVDINDRTYNMSIAALTEKLDLAQVQNRLPKIVIPVHFSGQSSDMKSIHALSMKYGFHIVEDASHAIGGSQFGKPVGSCRFSDITVFSFHPVKIVTTGEGGMALTNSPILAKKLELYRSHGVTRDPKLFDGIADGLWHYSQIALGYNYRMTDIQGALGLSQMKRLDEFVAKRNELAERYDHLLKETPWVTPEQDDFQISARHLYVVRLPDKLVEKKSAVFNFLRDMGVGVNVHYIPVHTQPYYRDKSIEYGDLSVSEDYYKSAISIPLYPKLTFAEQDHIVSSMNLALSEVSKRKD